MLKMVYLIVPIIGEWIKKYVSIICSMIIVVFTVLSICVPVFASEHDYEEVVDDYKGADDTWYQIFDYRLEGDSIVLYNYDRDSYDDYDENHYRVQGTLGTEGYAEYDLSGVSDGIYWIEPVSSSKNKIYRGFIQIKHNN